MFNAKGKDTLVETSNHVYKKKIVKVQSMLLLDGFQGFDVHNLMVKLPTSAEKVTRTKGQRARALYGQDIFPSFNLSKYLASSVDENLGKIWLSLTKI